MNKTIDAIVALGHELEEQQNAAHDLWTWLPSYKVAEKNHGDYASNFQPSVRDILVEAAMYLGSKHVGKPITNASELTPEQREFFCTCPCDEPHDA